MQSETAARAKGLIRIRHIMEYFMLCTRAVTSRFDQSVAEFPCPQLGCSNDVLDWAPLFQPGTSLLGNPDGLEF